jgi:hypothetical protein
MVRRYRQSLAFNLQSEGDAPDTRVEKQTKKILDCKTFYKLYKVRRPGSISVLQEAFFKERTPGRTTNLF